MRFPHELTVTLREKEYTIVDVSIGRAEPDVGIMSDYIDDFGLKNDKGEEVDITAMALTSAEEDQITEAIYNALRSYDEDYPEDE